MTAETREAAGAMPPLGLAAASLRRTTEGLAREVARPSDLRPAWSELDWAVARAAAPIQGISMLLAKRLSWSGPPAWQSFLENQREQSLLRDARIGELLRRLDDGCRQAGIPAVALKGSALRRLDLYAPGERPMGDIDLLVRPDDSGSIEAMLSSLDYVPAYSTRRHDIFEPRIDSDIRPYGEHVDNPLRIEIHTKVAEALPISRVDITSSLQAARLRPGLNAYPNLPALLLHLLLHAAGNMRANALRQIQLHDIALLSARLDEGDWNALLADPATCERRWWLYPALAMTERYYPGGIPAAVLREARTACPRALRFATDRRALTDVSWSNLRIHAFPGITWSRTPLEALRFVRSRALPSRTALDELKKGCNKKPHLYQIPWYGIPHGKRILRWLFSRPPRVQTMVSLRAALQHAHSTGE